MTSRVAPRCQRCSRTQHPIPLDDFHCCIACMQAIREQVTASWPAIDHDCDMLGAFHAWTIQHDRQAA